MSVMLISYIVAAIVITAVGIWGIFTLEVVVHCSTCGRSECVCFDNLHYPVSYTTRLIPREYNTKEEMAFYNTIASTIVADYYHTFQVVEGRQYGLSKITDQWEVIGGLDSDDHDYDTVAFNLTALNGF